MKKIIFIARAGQGAKSAATILSQSANNQNLNIQAFPEYGPERMGAPVKSYVKIDDKPIRDFSPIKKPNIIILIDKTLINLVLNLDLKDSILIINDTCEVEKYYQKYKLKNKIAVVDASKISFETIGLDAPSIPMIGALIKLDDLIKIESVNKVIKDFFTSINKEKFVESNLLAIKKCNEEVKL